MEKNKELTQNQIMQLTGYSRSSISEVLSQLSEDLLISEVKKPGDRKKYYGSNVDFEQYIQNFFIKVLRAPYTSLDFIPKCLEQLENTNLQTSEALHLKRFFHGLLAIDEVVQNYIENSSDFITDIYKSAYHDFSTNDRNEGKDAKLLKSDNKDQILIIKKQFLEKMEDIFVSFGGVRKEPFILLMIGLFENEPLTQDDLIKISGYSRSIISENLKWLVSAHLIQRIKKPNDRKKYYKPVAPLEQYLLGKFSDNKGLTRQLRQTLRDLINQTRAIDIDLSEKSRLIDFFNTNIKSYEAFEQYINEIEERYREQISST